MRIQRLNCVAVTAILFLGFLGSFAAELAAQTAELPRRTETVAWTSGSHDGNPFGEDEDTPVLAHQDMIWIPGAPWIQLQFGPGRLGKNSFVEITSLADGATQRLDATQLAQWGNRSAYFNGDAVEVNLFVGARDEGISIDVPEVVVGEWGRPVNESICGVDDRVASSEPRTGRIDPIGCTGWISQSGEHLSAGHCLAGGSSNQTLSFNVPPSLPDGTVQFPAPADQYSINRSSFNFVDGGIGNDWGVFAVFNNSQTGLQPISAQGSFSVAQNLGPANIRITGFGLDDGTTNQTNQTHVGPNAGSSGTTLRYRTDTRGGNSGSPVIDAATGVAVGIHTHGGCSSSGGNNNGTSFFNTALWNALGTATTDNAQFISQSVPAALAPGQTATVSVTMKNTGTSTWTRAGGYKLGSQNPQDNFTWGLSRVWLSSQESVAPGQNKTFTFNITAPSTPGFYNFQWRMVHELVRWFGAFSPNQKILVASIDNAQFISQSVPTTLTPGQTATVSVRMKNTGTTTWTRADGYKLGSQNPQDNLTWGLSRVWLSSSESVAPGQSKTFTFTITAPSTPGIYNFQWRMVHELVRWFGAFSPNRQISVTGPQRITLSSNADTYVSQSSPNTNYGTSSWLRVRWDGTGNGLRSFIRFQVPTIPGTILSAELKLRTRSSTVQAAFYRMNNMSWTESSPTWANHLDPPTTFTFLRSEANLAPFTTYAIDVTSALTGSGPLTIGIASGSDAGGQGFYSRHTAFPPMLEITYMP